jgi:uncharacterized membrane protein
MIIFLAGTNSFWRHMYILFLICNASMHVVERWDNKKKGVLVSEPCVEIFCIISGDAWMRIVEYILLFLICNASMHVVERWDNKKKGVLVSEPCVEIFCIISGDAWMRIVERCKKKKKNVLLSGPYVETSFL